ncbi:hypothetical protein DFH09DRAFT_1432234 [Mycena vulgaris]|nr:hypothetical protein DFH09DRAFT_1432234 [Mycena vulgaris]
MACPLHFYDQEQSLKTESDENRVLSDELAVRNERLAVRVVPCHSVDRLPDEIWLMVLCYILPPSWMLNGEAPLAPFPQSIWSMNLRAKLCIIGACRTGHRIGLELLYRRVTLRRIEQMLALVSALETRDGLGALVRNLEISCFVPHGYSALHK